MLPPRQPNPSATGTIKTKYAIVGAGFTGLAAARRLSELDPGAEIVVLEATTVGEGSSARNSGFVSPSDMAGGLGKDEIERNLAFNRSSAEGFDWLRELITRFGIDCDLHRSGRIKGAATPDGEKRVRATRDIAHALRIPHALLDREQMKARIGTTYYRCGLATEEGYPVQPAALIRGLADAMPANVRLFEQSPVVKLEKGAKWQLDTGDARITADTVIIAANASIKDFGYLRDRLVTIYTYAAITKKLPPAEGDAFGSMTSWGLLSAHRLGTTVRRVGPDRLMVRSLYSYERGMSFELVQSELLARFRRRYPELSHTDFDHCWGGVTALTTNGSPSWGRVDDNLYASAGCNGAGVVKGTFLGKKLAEQIIQGNVEDEVRRSYGSANWIAPEPFRSIGFHAIASLERRKAGLES